MKRKPNYLLIVVGILFGIFLGYLIAKLMDQSLFINESKSTGGPKYIEIPKSKADEMRKRYKDEQDDLWYPLRTNEGAILRGFWVDRKLIDSIARQDANYTGIQIYLGKDVDAKKREYSLIFVGTKLRPASPAPAGLITIDDDFGRYFDYVDPCPEKCGDSGPGNP